RPRPRAGSARPSAAQATASTWRPHPRQPTAAAPTMGPRVPSPAGTTRAPRLNWRRARTSSSAWAAAKKGGPNPRATEPATTARRRSRRLATDARARPTSRPVRAITSVGAWAAGRPVAASMEGPEASASRQPRPPQAQGRPSGTTTTWPTWPALPAAPSSRRPPSTTPPPTPVDTTTAMKSLTPAAAPTQPSARARALASLSTKVARPVSSASRRRRGKPRQAGMFSGDTASPPAVMGPPQPTPHTTGTAAPAPARPAATFAATFEAVVENVEQVLQGKEEAIRLALVCMVAEGHLLIEDVPGVGKTSLAKSLAASVDADWHRIQFTPDLLPSDVTGVTVYS